MNAPKAANQPYRLPPSLFDARCQACWLSAGLLLLVVASFWSLDLQWAQFFSLDAARSMGRFLSEFFPPDLSPVFLKKVLIGAWETLAMSVLGTLLAAVAGLALALPASHAPTRHAAVARPGWARTPTRLVLNALRSIRKPCPTPACRPAYRRRFLRQSSGRSSPGRYPSVLRSR